ncbi:hypothetical protein NIES2098_44020 [Calothrix sp. NIES-2098]|nr:hypothetical protein NIES2098_44020 [Calothrix sp. NIES-2098]
MIKIDVASDSLFLSVLMVWMYVMSEIKKTLVLLLSSVKRSSGLGNYCIGNGFCTVF